MKWININDEKPAHGSCIMIFSEDGKVAEGRYQKKVGNFIQYRWSAIKNNVTHWCEKPEGPSDNSGTKQLIENLNDKLKDKDYRHGWVSSIAMSQIDCERWYREKNNKVGKYLNYKDRHTVANEGAEYFLKLLSKDV